MSLFVWSVSQSASHARGGGDTIVAVVGEEDQATHIGVGQAETCVAWHTGLAVVVVRPENVAVHVNAKACSLT